MYVFGPILDWKYESMTSSLLVLRQMAPIPELPGEYGDVAEALPLNAPEELSKSVELHLYVNSNHAGDTKDCRSCTGYMV